jgi:hypothetical protein
MMLSAWKRILCTVFRPYRSRAYTLLATGAATRWPKLGHEMDHELAVRLLRGGYSHAVTQRIAHATAKAYGPLPGSTRVCAPRKGMGVAGVGVKWGPIVGRG